MTILISIDRALERQNRIIEQGINAKLLQNSVDGSSLIYPLSYLSVRAQYDFSKKKKDHRSITTLGAIGCYMSHENAWKEIVKKDKPELIIEDDITILDENYEKYLDDWISSDHSKPRILWMSYGYLNNTSLLWGTGSYAINPLAATLLLKNSRPIDIQVDSFMHLIIKLYNWDLELSHKLYFSQYETPTGPFKSLCQDYDDLNKEENHYYYN
jgi:GR25 family glycosyltransferase involved in LPS biosynthesis